MAARAARGIVSIRDHQGGSALVLRHDVDLDLTAVPRLAELEGAAGVFPTYCVMTTSDLYNPAAPESRRIIRGLADAGFDVGLHFWPEAYGGLAGEGLARKVGEEAALLADITGRSPVALSLHNPTAAGAFPAFAGYREAYGPELFAPARYLSDSRMRLREDPFAFVERTRGVLAQLLLHPEHFTEEGAGYRAIFAGVERRRAAVIDRYMRVNQTYADELPDGLLAALERRT